MRIGRSAVVAADWYLKMRYGVETDKKGKDMFGALETGGKKWELGDPMPKADLKDQMKEWQKEMEAQPLKIFKKADHYECMRFASKIPYSCVQELIDNTERISKYLEGRV